MDFETINNLVRTFDGSVVNLCYFFLDRIWNEDSASKYKSIMDFCEAFGMEKSNKTTEIEQCISDDELAHMKTLFEDYVDEILETTLKKAYQNEYERIEFYTLLWKNVEESPLLEELKEKAFALYDIVIDRKIPYYKLEKGLSMDAQKYVSLIDSNLEDIKKARFVLNSPISQKTEEASILLDIIENEDTYESKVIVLSSIISFLRSEKKRILDRIRELNE